VTTEEKVINSPSSSPTLEGMISNNYHMAMPIQLCLNLMKLLMNENNMSWHLALSILGSPLASHVFNK